MRKLKGLHRTKPLFSGLLILAFFINTLGPWVPVYADQLRLPQPGVMVPLSPQASLPVLKGIKVDPDNPLHFDFILDRGNSDGHQSLKSESVKLIKYFLAGLTIPDKDLWVNLSPYEKNRIIPNTFGLTEMGRDLLAQDYLLKQITATLIYPQGQTGQKFWKSIYQEAQRRYGTTDIPVNTFNKVWIVPEKAVVYENARVATAYVAESRLKIMLEQDYMALGKNAAITDGHQNDINALGSQIVRTIVLPKLEKEINEGRNFAGLRQIYNSLILAAWYKRKITGSILAQVYVDRTKVTGMAFDGLGVQDIYQRYLQAFKKGVFNYIEDDLDPVTQTAVPRKYFSGGVDFDWAMSGKTAFNKTGTVLEISSGIPRLPPPKTGQDIEVDIDLAMTSPYQAFTLGSQQYPLWQKYAYLYFSLPHLIAGQPQIPDRMDLFKPGPSTMTPSDMEKTGRLLWKKDFNVRLFREMRTFIQDPDKGFGLPESNEGEGMGLLYAFAGARDSGSLDVFLLRLKGLGQQDRVRLVQAGYSFFKANAFADFLKMLNERREDSFLILIKSFQDELFQVTGIVRQMEDSKTHGWQSVLKFDQQAEQYPLLRDFIFRKMIVILRLLRQGVITDQRTSTELASIRVPFLSQAGRLLKNGNIPWSLKRQLLNSLPFMQEKNINTLYNRALALGIGKNLAGQIHTKIHLSSSIQDIAVVRAYRVFVESNGRNQRAADDLRRWGYKITGGDVLSGAVRKQRLADCDKLLESLKDIYGAGSLESMVDLAKNMQPFFDKVGLSDMPGRIKALGDHQHPMVPTLEAAVKLRQDISLLWDKAEDEDFYNLLYLDARLETLIHINLPMGQDMSSPECLWCLLENSRLSGYGDARMPALAGTLKTLIQEPDSRDRQMRLYAILQRAERMVKDILGQTIENYQAIAEQTARSWKVRPSQMEEVRNFSANMLRGENVFLLSKVINNDTRQIRKALGWSGWQVIAPGKVIGTMIYVPDAEGLKKFTPSDLKTKILVMDRLPDDSPVVSEAAGIIVFESDGVMTHPAILARQNHLPYMVCPDRKKVEKYFGKNVVLDTHIGGDRIVQEKGEHQAFPSAQPKHEALVIPQAFETENPEKSILPRSYTSQTVGMKAFRNRKIDLQAHLKDQAKHLTQGFGLYNREVLRRGKITLPAGKVTSKTLARMRERIESLSLLPSTLQAIRRDIRAQIPQGLVILRSSTNAEDLHLYSGAGLYSSFPGVDPDNLQELEKYIKKVWASVWNERAYMDRQRNGIDHRQVSMSVMIHQLVDSQYSYVLHTDNPLDPTHRTMLLEIVQGQGEALVSGSADYQGMPHQFIYNRLTGSIQRLSYADKDYCLMLRHGRLVRELVDYSKDIFANAQPPQSLLTDIFHTGLTIKKLFGDDQDIEGSLVNKRGSLRQVVLQSRDEQEVVDQAQIVGVQVLSVPTGTTDNGGIDFNTVGRTLQVDAFGGNGIRMNISPALAEQMQSAGGFVPVVKRMRPLESWQIFLGIRDSH